MEEINKKIVKRIGYNKNQFIIWRRIK